VTVNTFIKLQDFHSSKNNKKYIRVNKNIKQQNKIYFLFEMFSFFVKSTLE